MKKKQLEELKKYRVRDVFTPASASPNLNFVARGEVEDDLNLHLSTKGRPICVEGPYQCGKTSLVLKAVNDNYGRVVHIVCNDSTTFDDLMTRALDDLAPFYAEVKEGKSTKMSPGLGVEFWFFHGHLGGGGKEEVATERPVIQPQKTSAAIARFMVAAEAALVIDDAHKLPPQEFAKVAATMREWQTLVFDSGDAKMVVIASDTMGSTVADRLIERVPDLARRLVNLTLRLMSDEELAKIISRGEELLNVDMSDVQTSILEYSFGYPGTCHDLCAHTCHAAAITQTQEAKVHFTATHLQKALKKFVKECSPAIKLAYQKLREKLSESISPAFYTCVLQKVASHNMSEGYSLTRLTGELALALGLSEEVVIKGVEEFADESLGVMRLDTLTKVLSFREPLYRAFYIQHNAAETAAIEHDEAIEVLLRVLRQEE